MRPDDYGGNDSVVTAASSTQRPVQIAVLAGTGGEFLALGGNDFELECLVGGETIRGAESGVTATLGEAAGDGDGGTLSCDDDKAMRCSCFDGFGANDTRGDSEGRSGVVVVGIFDNFSVFKVPKPDAETACAGGSAEEASKCQYTHVQHFTCK